MLKLKDLKQQGLHLSQLEAQEIHSAINGVSQGHNPTGIIFEKSVSHPIAEKPDLLKDYYAEVQRTNGKLVKENSEVNAENIELRKSFEKSQADQIEIEKSNSELSAKITELQNVNKELEYQLNEAKAIKVNGDIPNEIIKGKPGRKPNK